MTERANSEAARNSVYDVRDPGGRLVAQHVREDTSDGGKKVRWRLPDGTWGLNGTSLCELPLYGSEQVPKLGEDQLVVVEGEKARDALDAAGIRAVGTVTGAGGTPGLEALEVLRDREVTLWPDNDEAGRAHMRRVAERLRGIATEVRWYEWPEAAEKGDDAADHQAVKSRDPKAADLLLNELMCAPAWGSPIEDDNEELYSAPIGKLLSEVTPERVDWLWKNRIAKGKLSIWEGDPGVGKRHD